MLRVCWAVSIAFYPYGNKLLVAVVAVALYRPLKSGRKNGKTVTSNDIKATAKT